MTEEQKSSLNSILLSHSGRTPLEIAEVYQVSIHSIREWLKQWERYGLEGLKLKPGRGRKPKLDVQTNQHVQTVKTFQRLISDFYHKTRLAYSQLSVPHHTFFIF